MIRRNYSKEFNHVWASLDNTVLKVPFLKVVSQNLGIHITFPRGLERAQKLNPTISRSAQSTE